MNGMTNETKERIEQLAQAMPPISLDEMSSIRLMKRTDQKFVTTVSTLLQLLAETRDSYYAQRIDGRCTAPYATTYWDDAETHALFRMHETGHMPRRKVRVRTYLNSDTSFLEVKSKDNHGKTTKQRVRVPSVRAVTEDGAGSDFVKETAGLDMGRLNPAVSNEFSRLTLVNLAKTERLTIDFGISFFNHATGHRAEMEDAVVIELKRDGRCPSPILPILRSLRVKPAGFSKYCVGAAVTDPSLRINRFKKRLIKLGKTASSVCAAL